MSNFFTVTDDVDATFEIFSTPHLVALGILVLLCLAVIAFRKQIAKTAKNQQIAQRILFVILIINEIAFYSWKIYAGEFSLTSCLPLNMCTMSIFICIYILITNDKRIFPMLYFMGLGGATQALLTPSMAGYNFPHFRFFEYFTAHIMIILTICYLIAVCKYKITFKETIKAFLFIQVAGVIAMIGNVLFGGNYMFLAYKPTSTTVLSYLADWPYYILQLELVLIIVIVLLSIPFIIIDKKKFFFSNTNSNK